MIEIFLLVFLTIQTGKEARRKNLTPWKWQLAMLACWIALELPLFILSYYYTQSFLIASFSGMLGGLLGYFLLKSKLNKQAPGE